MALRHPETELVPFLSGELTGAERARVAEHVAACERCRKSADSFREILGALAASRPEPPAIQWGTYRAEIRRKLDAKPAAGAWSLGRLVPLAMSVALASVLFLLVGESDHHVPRLAELSPPEQAAIGTRLDLLEHYPVIENLDLLEDLEVIRHLDDLTHVQAG